MSLFRRGTKLLRLGSGLRDCCCRPENPEECWCPDWCRYYMTGTLPFMSANDFPDFPASCTDDLVSSRVLLDPIGIITEQTLGVAEVFNAGRGPGGIGFKYASSHTGKASNENRDLVYPDLANPFVCGFEDSSMIVNYFTQLIFSFGCSFFEATPRFSFQVELEQEVRTQLSPGGLFGCLKVLFYRRRFGGTEYYGNLSQIAECVDNTDWTCNPPEAHPEYAHLLQDLTFVISLSGFSVNGTSYDWFESRDFTEDYGVDLETDDYPFDSATFAIKAKRFCIAGDCDCTESLTGMTVTFEGKTFTYGSLQTITEGVDTWQEERPGLFRRTTRETCDGTYVAAVKIADVNCEVADKSYWAVYLESQCYERDEATCPASADARRIMQWTGVFTCGEDGKPGGTPHSAIDAADPPDLDSNTTLGTPAAECAGDLDLPAISFG